MGFKHLEFNPAATKGISPGVRECCFTKWVALMSFEITVPFTAADRERDRRRGRQSEEVRERTITSDLEWIPVDID